MTGATLGSAQLGATPLASVPQPAVTGFIPAFAINVNAVIQIQRVDHS